MYVECVHAYYRRAYVFKNFQNLFLHKTYCRVYIVYRIHAEREIYAKLIHDFNLGFSHGIEYLLSFCIRGNFHIAGSNSPRGTVAMNLDIISAMKRGMKLLYTGDVQMVAGQNCLLFALGTDTGDQFVREFYYAVSDNYIFTYDAVNDMWYTYGT